MIVGASVAKTADMPNFGRSAVASSEEVRTRTTSNGSPGIRFHHCQEKSMANRQKVDKISEHESRPYILEDLLSEAPTSLRDHKDLRAWAW